MKYSIDNHEKACKVYSKYFESTSEGYNCKVCSFKSSFKSETINTQKKKTGGAWFRMYYHLKDKHKWIDSKIDSSESTTKKGTKEVPEEIKNDSPQQQKMVNLLKQQMMTNLTLMNTLKQNSAFPAGKLQRKKH